MFLNPRSPLPRFPTTCHSPLAMTKPLMVLACLCAMLLTGCVTNTVTNLTASSQPRDPKGMYRVEYQWDSTQQTIRPGSVRPFVIVGTETYEMKPVMKMHNRWEAWIPVSPSQSEVTYSFKVDYQYSDFGAIKGGSKLTKDYTLVIR